MITPKQLPYASKNFGITYRNERERERTEIWYRFGPIVQQSKQPKLSCVDELIHRVWGQSYFFTDWSEWSDINFRKVRFRTCNNSEHVQIFSTLRRICKGSSPNCHLLSPNTIQIGHLETNSNITAWTPDLVQIMCHLVASIMALKNILMAQ